MCVNVLAVGQNDYMRGFQIVAEADSQIPLMILVGK